MARASLLPLAATLLATACSSPEEVAERTGVAANASAAGSNAAASASSAAGKAVSESTEAYEFEFAYPGAAAAIPPLADWLDSRAAQIKASLSSEADEGQADAQASGYSFNPHSYSMDWKVVADLPGWLSLSGEFATYSGGAHGMYGMDSLVWHKGTGKKLDPLALFRSPAALTAALSPRLCDALNTERAERRGEPVAAGSDDMFDQCVGVDEATVLVGSSNGKTFDRLTVWIGPYVAGPYAEGAFELDFPLDRAVLAAVKQEYREAFSVKR